jgi:hypothetical protein
MEATAGRVVQEEEKASAGRDHAADHCVFCKRLMCYEVPAAASSILFRKIVEH